ncbi:MAG: DUF5361 domain-containing protein [Sciscionella sp.]
MIVGQSPRTSALARSMAGEDAEWGLSEHLQAAIVDGVSFLAWMQSTDGEKNRNRPKPLPRPGVKQEPTDRIGSESRPLDEMAAWLAARNPAQHEA